MTQRQAEVAERDERLQQLGEQAQTSERLALEHLRRALLAENRGEIVAELVQGATPQALVASVERAKAAWGVAMEAAGVTLAVTVNGSPGTGA